MKNLFLLFWRNNFLILFVILSGLSFYLIYDQQQFHRASVLNSSNELSGNIMATVNKGTSYLSLRENNEKIVAQNAELMQANLSSYFDISAQRDTVRDTVYRLQYSYIVAHVINNSVNKRNNFITIDKGLINGLKPDMGVIGPAGVVGVVKDVSEHFATVQSLLHSKWTPSAKLKNSNFPGYISWDGSNPLYITLQNIPANAEVHKGDTVITTPFSPLFPEGIMVGNVVEIKQKQAGDNHIIKVKLSTNFNNISHVYVIVNRFKEERDQLESKTEAEDKKTNGN